MSMSDVGGGGGLGGGVTGRRQRQRKQYYKLKFRHLIFAGFGIILIGYTFLVLSFLKFSNDHDKLAEQNNNILKLRKNGVDKNRNINAIRDLRHGQPQQQHEEERHEIKGGDPSKSSTNNNGRTKKDANNNSNNKPKIATNEKEKQPPTNANQQKVQKPPLPVLSLSTFDEWKEYAGELAMKVPSDILQTLQDDDPFGVRTFETNLQNYESNKGAFLNLEEISSSLFPCPISSRITIPDHRNHIKATKFRNDTIGSYLFFQHLRKAGGTNFCTLAQHNLPKQQVPAYYCMPDMDWSNRTAAGYMSKYTNEDISDRMTKSNFRILGNEFDPFDSTRFFDLDGAIFATSFRKPLDRALSQFRFECIEDRGCSEKNVTNWWDRRFDLINIYTYTFSLTRRMRWLTIGKTDEAAIARKQAILEAMDTMSKFNLVLVMEWLAYSPNHVVDVLGFDDTSTMTERIRPHFHQAKRNDGQEHNNLGSAGISKASWDPKEYLSPQQYKRMSEDLALDAILTDAARRIFLERIVCDDMKEHQAQQQQTS